MKTKKFFTLLVIICPLLSLFSKDPNSFDDQLATFCNTAKTLQNQGLLDGPVLVTQGNKILLNLANDEKNSTQYMIGSVSKQFLSVALLKVLYDSTKSTVPSTKIEEVRKQLQLPISTFLPPQSPLWGGKIPSWANTITLHQLLSHTGGIPDYLNFISSEWKESYHSPQELIQIIVEKPLLFQPGTKYSYSNTNYTLLAEILEVITQKPFSQYMDSTLFQPVHLTSTSNPDKGSPTGELQQNPFLARLAFPMNYNLKGDQRKLYPAKTWFDASVAKGSGAMVSTANDLLTWNKALHKTKSILPEPLYTLFTTPVLDNYCYGIAIAPTTFGPVLFHGGQIEAYRSYLVYLKDQDVHIILLSNADFDGKSLMPEYEAILEELKSKIPDELEREQTAEKMILEKYPSIRGMSVLDTALKKLLGIDK